MIANRLFIGLTCLLLLNSCGFQLRGNYGFHFSTAYIQAEAADLIASEVSRTLSEAGIKITSAPKDAQIVVFLRNERVDRRVLSVSAASGKMQEIELNGRAELEVRQPDDKVLLETRLLSLLRDYSFDETAVLAMGNEEYVLRLELLRDLVAQVLRSLQTIKL